MVPLASKSALTWLQSLDAKGIAAVGCSIREPIGNILPAEAEQRYYAWLDDILIAA